MRKQAGEISVAQDGLWRALAIDPSLSDARLHLTRLVRRTLDR